MRDATFDRFRFLLPDLVTLVALVPRGCPCSLVQVGVSAQCSSATGGAASSPGMVESRL
jgi:hypothetical protein